METKFQNNGGFIDGQDLKTRPAYLYKYLLSKIVMEIQGSERVYSLIIENDNPFLIDLTNDTIQDVIDDFNALVPLDEIPNAFEPIPEPEPVFPPYVPPVVPPVTDTMPKVIWTTDVIDYSTFEDPSGLVIPFTLIDGTGANVLDVTEWVNNYPVPYIRKKGSDIIMCAISGCDNIGLTQAHIHYNYPFQYKNWVGNDHTYQVFNPNFNDEYYFQVAVVYDTPEDPIYSNKIRYWIPETYNLFDPTGLTAADFHIVSSLDKTAKVFNFSALPINQPIGTIFTASDGYFDVKFSIKNSASQVLETLTNTQYTGFNPLTGVCTPVNFDYGWLYEQSKQRFPFQDLIFDMWVQTNRNNIPYGTFELRDEYFYISPLPYVETLISTDKNTASLKWISPDAFYDAYDYNDATKGMGCSIKAINLDNVNYTESINLHFNDFKLLQSIDILTAVNILKSNNPTWTNIDFKLIQACAYYTENDPLKDFNDLTETFDLYQYHYVEPPVPVDHSLDDWLYHIVDLSSSVKYDFKGIGMLPTKQECLNALKNVILQYTERPQLAEINDENFAMICALPIIAKRDIFIEYTGDYERMTEIKKLQLENSSLTNLVGILNNATNNTIERELTVIYNYGYRPISIPQSVLSETDIGLRLSFPTFEARFQDALYMSVRFANRVEKVITSLYFRIGPKIIYS